MSSQSKPNPTQSDTFDGIKLPPVPLAPQVQNDLMATESRTKIRKRLFIESFLDSMGIVLVACKKVGISRDTFYEWRKTDRDFAEALARIEGMQIDETHDRMLQLIREGDGPTIRWYLERRDGRYMPKGVLGVVPAGGGKTFEDVIDTMESGIIETQTHDQADQQNNNGGGVQHPRQAGPVSAAAGQPSPALLPAQADAP